MTYQQLPLVRVDEQPPQLTLIDGIGPWNSGVGTEFRMVGDSTVYVLISYIDPLRGSPGILTCAPRLSDGTLGRTQQFRFYRQQFEE
jgi:hypothetical protein